MRTGESASGSAATYSGVRVVLGDFGVVPVRTGVVGAAKDTHKAQPTTCRQDEDQ